MGDILETLYDLLRRPKTAFTEITESKTVSQACIIVLCVATLTILAATAASLQGDMGMAGLIVILIGLTVLKWGVSTAIWHLLAELLGGRGSVKCLLTAIGFTYFIEILIIPAYMLDSFLWPGSMEVTVAAGIVISVWSTVLHIFAIRAVYEISCARAALIFFLPLLIFILFVLILVSMMYTAFLSAVGSILANPPQF